MNRCKFELIASVVGYSMDPSPFQSFTSQHLMKNYCCNKKVL